MSAKFLARFANGRPAGQMNEENAFELSRREMSPPLQFLTPRLHHPKMTACVLMRTAINSLF
jgi:hypothetical protein